MTTETTRGSETMAYETWISTDLHTADPLPERWWSVPLSGGDEFAVYKNAADDCDECVGEWRINAVRWHDLGGVPVRTFHVTKIG